MTGTEPLFGVAFAWLLLAEPVSVATLLGGALILGGTFLGVVSDRKAA